MISGNAIAVGYEPFAASRTLTQRAVLTSAPLVVTLTITNQTTNSSESNPLPPLSSLEITYSLASSSTGAVALGDYVWAAATPDRANGVFGVSWPYEPTLIKFVATTNEPLLRLRFDQGRSSLEVDGGPGSVFVLVSSTNLVDWLPLATNLSPSSYFETNSGAGPRRFFKATPHQERYANLVFEQTPTNAHLLWIHGVAGCVYVLEASLDLREWSGMLTNICPFFAVETNRNVPATFYRARLLRVS
jgi:hypothetical protein